MTQMRIGDAERDAAGAALGEHYAAGRLTKDEYDERIDRVWAAKYQDDLAPLFSDLPRRSTVATAARGAASATGIGRSRPVRRRGRLPGYHPLMLLGPIIVAGIIAAAVIAGASWLFLLFFLWCLGGMGRRRNHHWAHSG